MKMSFNLALVSLGNTFVLFLICVNFVTLASLVHLDAGPCHHLMLVSVGRQGYRHICRCRWKTHFVLRKSTILFLPLF
jgi:hypothetical protein